MASSDAASLAKEAAQNGLGESQQVRAEAQVKRASAYPSLCTLRAPSLDGDLKKAADNDASLTKFIAKDYGNVLFSSQMLALAKSLKTNTHIKEVSLAHCGMIDKECKVFAEMLKTNKTITHFDIGYNKVSATGIVALADALAVNKALTEVKIHRMEKDYGTAAELKLVQMWKTNTTLTRCYATLHDRRCNQVNTASEVRNKTIARRIKQGKSWADLDPAQAEARAKLAAEAQEKKASALKIANAPISAKVASTGGPYTLKQLTCLVEYLPADVDKTKKESYLTDAEFKTVFNMSKADFSKLAGWKKNGLKKSKRLH